jgi:AcrR family transcriptional regulator
MEASWESVSAGSVRRRCSDRRSWTPHATSSFERGTRGCRCAKSLTRSTTPPPAIYLYFKDRDDLVFSVCEQLMEGLVRELQQVVNDTKDPLTALKIGLRRYIEFGVRHAEHYAATFMIPHRHSPDIDLQYKRPESMSMQAFAFLPKLVGECVRLKKLRKVDVEVTSRALWAGIHGMTSLLIAIPTFEWGNKDRVIDQLITMMLDGLKPVR